MCVDIKGRKFSILASLIVYTTDWELHIFEINLKGSMYYFINNMWYKYTGITKQKDKYLMADKKLRIHRKLKIEQHKHQTDMNSDAPYDSAVRTSLIPLHGQRSWGLSPSPLCKVEGGKTNLPPPFFFALNLRKNFFFT